MSWGPQPAERHGAPRIDLLPRELVEQRLLRRQRTGVGAAFVLLLALLGLWYVVENAELAKSRDEADQERAVATGLRARRAQLQPLADLESRIAAADQLREQVYAHEIRFSTVMRDISAIVPEDVWLTSMTATFNAATDPAAPSGGSGTPSTTPGSPGAGSPVANITFAGAGLGHVDVGGFLRALARGPRKGGQPVYLNPYFTSSQRAGESGQTTVTFSATVDLSTAAYSGRYQTQTGTVTP